MRITNTIAAALLAGLLSVGCADLEVANPESPDRERALKTASDVEALIAGSYAQWYNTNTATNSFGAILATTSYQHSGTAANFGMVDFSSWPKVPAHHMPANSYYNEFANNWIWFYRAVSSVVTGIKTLNDETVTLPDADLARAKAYGYFVLGLVHGSAAILYDQAYIYDPEIAMEDVKLSPSKDVLAASLKYFDRAIAEATGKTFTIPELWMARATTSADLIRLTRSYKARYRAAYARNPQDRAAVNWDQVIADVDAGITTDFTWNQATGSGWGHGLALNMYRTGPWGQMSYQVLGMADQSGAYQKWIARDPWQRHPNLSADQLGEPFLIQTPDKRFPQGADRATQTANKGTLFEILTTSGGFSSQWVRPDRGSFRWSYYRYRLFDAWATPATNRGNWPEMRVREMKLLKAEGLLRKNDRAAAAAIINETRVPAGLNATDAAGLNTSCVPKLPNGQCGDLMEMLKWEKRLETMYAGLHFAPWYFDGRGWGDLAEGTFLQLPVPGREMQLLLSTPYTFGGTAGGGAPKGTYGY